MNVLLLYPTQSDLAAGNASHQTECLVRATERSLTRQGFSPITLRQSASTIGTLAGSEHRLTQHSGALIFVIGFHDDLTNDRLQQLARTRNCPVIRLQARFPGALIRHDIEMDSFCADGTPLGAIHPVSFQPVTVPESYHYAQFAPTPSANVGHSVTPNLSPLPDDVIKPLIILDVTTDTKRQDCHHDVTTITTTLQRFNNIPELALIINDCTGRGSDNHRQSSELRRELDARLTHKLQTRIVTPEVGSDVQETIPFLRQFDIGFFGGSRQYADAIELGMPVYAWRQSESTTLLNELLVAQLPKTVNSMHKTLRAHINQLQRELINELPGLHHTTTLANRIDVLDAVLARLVQQLNPMADNAVASSELTVPGLPIIPVEELEYPCTPAQHTRRRIQQFQRKLLKFRQSPTRFLRDSQTPLGQRLSDLLPPHNT